MEKETNRELVEQMRNIPKMVDLATEVRDMVCGKGLKLKHAHAVLDLAKDLFEDVRV